MTVKELIEELQECDPNRLVVLSRDEEGNSFAECDGFSDDTKTYSRTYKTRIRRRRCIRR